MPQASSNTDARAATGGPPKAGDAAATGALDPDLAALSSWTLEMLAAEIQAQRQHLADLSDFLQVLQDDNHVKDPAFSAQVLELMRAMETRLTRWEAEFAGILKK